jgi:hypothetical protein
MANGGKASVLSHGPQMANGGKVGGKASVLSHGPQMANGGKALMASPHAQAVHSKGGKVGGLQADPAKQLPGGPCNECNRTQSIKWHAAGTQCSACYTAAYRERKRTALQAEQKGRQNIQQAFAAAAAKKLKHE